MGKKEILICLAMIAGIVLLAVVIGVFLPKQHTATQAAFYHQPPEALWLAITTPSKFPEWRRTVTRVAPVSSATGHLSWIEYDRHGRGIPYEIVESDPPRKLVTRIADDSLPFGGTWTFDLSPQDGGTLLRITENGEVRNPFFRFMARYVYGYRSTLDTYLKALEQKFGEDASLQD